MLQPNTGQSVRSNTARLSKYESIEVLHRRSVLTVYCLSFFFPQYLFSDRLPDCPPEPPLPSPKVPREANRAPSVGVGTYVGTESVREEESRIWDL